VKSSNVCVCVCVCVRVRVCVCAVKGATFFYFFKKIHATRMTTFAG